VNAEFNWWLLIVGLAVGVGVTWLILADIGRREEDLSTREREEEATFLAEQLERRGLPTSAETVELVLELHEAYAAQRPLADELERAPAVDAGPTADAASTAEPTPDIPADPLADQGPAGTSARPRTTVRRATATERADVATGDG
jgi:hypothetical protein